MKIFSKKNNNYRYGFEHLRDIPPFTFDNREFLIKLLSLYAMYRNSIYDTRLDQTLDADVAKFDTEKFDYTYNPDDKKNRLYHYSAYIGLDALQEIFHVGAQVRIAHQEDPENHYHKICGFIVYFADAEKNHIYISHVTSRFSHQGIGQQLMQQVLDQYPPETDFYLCVRKSNQGAGYLYEKLGFKIDDRFLDDYGYKDTYFYGMSYQKPALEKRQANGNSAEEPSINNNRRSIGLY